MHLTRCTSFWITGFPKLKIHFQNEYHAKNATKIKPCRAFCRLLCASFALLPRVASLTWSSTWSRVYRYITRELLRVTCVTTASHSWIAGHSTTRTDCASFRDVKFASTPPTSVAGAYLLPIPVAGTLSGRRETVGALIRCRRRHLPLTLLLTVHAVMALPC